MQNQRSALPAQPAPMSSVNAGQPLSGKTILVTREREQAATLIDMLTGLGARVILFPTIEIIPPASWDACDTALTNIHSYDGIIYTSANAVRYFMNRAVDVHNNRIALLNGKKIFTLGKKTQEAIELSGLNAIVFEGTQDSLTFGKQLSQQELKGKRFLFPKGNLARAEFLSALRERGAVVDEIVVYRTQQPSSVDSKPIEELLNEKEIDVVLFFSPSSITNFLSIISGKLLMNARIATIGHTTAEAAHSANLHVNLIAGEPTTENLVSSIVQFYE